MRTKISWVMSILFITSIVGLVACGGSGGSVDQPVVTAPQNLSAVAYSSNQIHLFWNSVTSNNSVQKYNIYRDGTYLKFTTDLWTSDSGLTGNRRYCYQVSAVDSRGNESSRSANVCITTPSDDTISEYGVLTIDANGKMTKQVTYNASGPDNVWFTADDTVFNCYTYTYNTNGKITKHVHYNGPGPDNAWFTADDALYAYNTRTYDANGNQTQTFYYVSDGSGPDGVWFTADDKMAAYSRNIYDPTGKLIKQVHFGTGPDNVWFTADDAILIYITYTYDANEKLIKEITYDGAGPDNVWFTVDDAQRAYFTHTYDANGKRTKYIYYTGPGADNAWFTADDVIQFYNMSIYNSNGQLLQSDNYANGDELQYYVTYTFAASGNGHIGWTKYGGPGPDAVWFSKPL